MKFIKNNKEYFILLVVTVAIFLVGVQSSPLYHGVLNNDSSVFRILGQGILDGKVMYRDLFDHKGPIMYFIQAIGLLINNNMGIFIVECVFAFIGNIYLYKISKVYLSKKNSLCIAMIYYILLFPILHDGNLTEEYAVSILFIAIYYMIKVFEKGNKISFYIIGATFAFNFLIKATYIAPWIAFAIIYLFYTIKEKKIKELRECICYITLGIITIFLPIAIYFSIHTIWNEFFNCYFILNTKYSAGTLLDKIDSFFALISIYEYILFMIIIGIPTILLLKFNNNKVKCFIVLFTIFSVVLAGFAPNMYEHYLIPVLPVVCMYLIFFIKYITDNCTKWTSIIENIAVVVSGIAIIVFIIGLYRMNYVDDIIYKQEELEQVKKYIDPSKENQLFVLGNQPGYYLFFGINIDFKYFYQFPVIKYNDAIQDELIRYITEKKPKVMLVDSSVYLLEEYDEVMDLVANMYEPHGPQDRYMAYMLLKEN